MLLSSNAIFNCPNFSVCKLALIVPYQASTATLHTPCPERPRPPLLLESWPTPVRAPCPPAGAHHLGGAPTWHHLAPPATDLANLELLLQRRGRVATARAPATSSSNLHCCPGWLPTLAATLSPALCNPNKYPPSSPSASCSLLLLLSHTILCSHTSSWTPFSGSRFFFYTIRLSLLL